MEIEVKNVNHAPEEFFWRLRDNHISEHTRNGPVLRFLEPVNTVYLNPTQRVLFWPERDANPFFHLMESIWILAGRRDVAFPALFNSNIANYSDDGEIFNAAYGYRIRHHFHIDQLLSVVKVLSKDPTTRQAVVQIWSPADLIADTKDKACNMQLIFDVTQGKLNMTVINRSNDALWGAYGANAVHFSFIHEFVCLATGIQMGVYRQCSHNLHVYTKLYGDKLDAYDLLTAPPNTSAYDYYRTREYQEFKLFGPDEDPREFLTACHLFCEYILAISDDLSIPSNMPMIGGFNYLTQVARPMAMAYLNHKEKEFVERDRWLLKVSADDWYDAGLMYFDRRETNG